VQISNRRWNIFADRLGLAEKNIPKLDVASPEDATVLVLSPAIPTGKEWENMPRAHDLLLNTIAVSADYTVARVDTINNFLDAFLPMFPWRLTGTSDICAYKTALGDVNTVAAVELLVELKPTVLPAEHLPQAKAELVAVDARSHERPVLLLTDFHRRFIFLWLAREDGVGHLVTWSVSAYVASLCLRVLIGQDSRVARERLEKLCGGPLPFDARVKLAYDWMGSRPGVDISLSFDPNWEDLLPHLESTEVDKIVMCQLAQCFSHYPQFGFTKEDVKRTQQRLVL
jgi:hypothetical protein